MLTRQILSLGQQDYQRPEFLGEASRALLDASRCDAIEIYLQEQGRCYRSTTTHARSVGECYEIISLSKAPPSATGGAALEALCRQVLAGRAEGAGPNSTTAGSFWIGSAKEPIAFTEAAGEQRRGEVVLGDGAGYESIALIPFALDEGNRGLLVMKDRRRGYFVRDKVSFFEGIAQVLGISIVHHRTQLALRERVKELTCLYGISKLVGSPAISLDEILRSAVDLFPPAWLYPEIASARIVLDDQAYESRDFREGCHQLRAGIVIDGLQRGFVEVTYAEERPELDEGPFLFEERSLIDAIAKELGLLVEQHQAEEERARLQEQLRHADRLATIGQLSAGVAHELNEPLSSILGFAQLSQKDPQCPAQLHKDLERIVAAALHAREVVQKLMLFARQTPPQKSWVNLNLLIQDGLYFLESRCAKSGIDLVRDLEEDLPEITADPGQLYQVLINLAVNAVQSMPAGGRLTMRSARSGTGVTLTVEDTGVGMSEEVQRKIFLPFFTTKDIGEGTGLGLAVVEGIVTSHGGVITVESEVGVGTTFSVQLPVEGLEVGKRSR